MKQTEIPCILMRGGTSRAPYYNRADLPAERETLARVLVAAMGAGSPLQVNGIGGGQPTTSKVAMLSPSDHQWAQVDYFFAQVHAEKAQVDFSPSCGNILAGVGPAAVEMGLVGATEGQTIVRIRNTNTGALIEASFQTPGGAVEYDGQASIDGVPGTASPIILNFMEVVGSKTGKLFPMGEPIVEIAGHQVTCIDVAVPMVIGRAMDFGISGYESSAELDGNDALFERVEAVRIRAGEMMGFEDVGNSVVPKFGLLAKPRKGGAIAARYLMPWKCHPSMAVTGSVCIGSCLLAPGTVASGLAVVPDGSPAELRIEHPSGSIDVVFDYRIEDRQFTLNSAGLLRTARKLFTGTVCVPNSVWAPDQIMNS